MLKKDCFRNAPWSITSKLHAVCEQSWTQIYRIEKFSTDLKNSQFFTPVGSIAKVQTKVAHR